MRTLIDSSGWIEYFSGSPLSKQYEPYLKDRSGLITPTIVLYEVYTRVKRELGEERGLVVVGQLASTQVISLTQSIAILAADVSLQYRLAMADAVIYATSQDQKARLVTSDADLKDLPAVIYIH